MYRLSLLISLLLNIGMLMAQNPHGEKLAIDCKKCHNPASWSFNKDSSLFSHSDVGFVLEGQHQNTNCKKCHTSLVFEDIENTCTACHTDVHSMSVGNDCARCHTPNNWLVDNIPELHEQNGFPLLGQHRMAACIDCHKSETNLRWDRKGNECYTCHIANYNATKSPNHLAAGFPTNCTECHNPGSQKWIAENFHFYFPLVGKHNIQDCKSCHGTAPYSAASSECVSCHRDKYESTTNPNHVASNFSVNCTECHSGDSWRPARFKEHDGQYFPIYSGKHKGTWSSCNDCHIGGDNSTFSCIDCHTHSNQAQLAGEHDEAGGYSFNSNACFSCHPTGVSDD